MSRSLWPFLTQIVGRTCAPSHNQPSRLTASSDTNEQIDIATLRVWFSSPIVLTFA